MSINHVIVRDDYVAGSYLREEMRGYFQFKRYNFGSVYVDAAKGNFDICDKLVEKLLKNNVIKEYEYKEYYNLLKEYFSSFERLAKKSDEEIYGEINQIRKKIFSNKFIKFIKGMRKAELEKINRLAGKCNDWKTLLYEVIYPGIPKKKRKKKSPINQVNLLISKVYEKPKNLIIIPGDYRQVPFILKLLTFTLWPRWKQYYDSKNYEIIILIKKETVFYEPDYEDWKYIREIMNCDDLNFLLENEIIKFRFYEDNVVGINFSKMKKNLIALFEGAVSGKYLVLGLNEDIMFSLHGVKFKYFIITSIKSVRAQRYTNLYLESDGKLPYLIGFVPQNTLPAYSFTGVEKIRNTFYHFNHVYEQYRQTGPIEDVLPDLNVNFYSTTFYPNNFPELRLKQREYSLKDIFNNRDKKFNNLINSILPVRYISCNYVFNKSLLKNNESIVMVRGFIAMPQTINILPFLADDFEKGVISPRELIKKGIINDWPCLYLNLLYFVTDKIICTYNSIRSNRPLEQLTPRSHYVGYRLTRNANGLTNETFPLYNKGFIAFRPPDIFFFGRRQLEGGTLFLNDKKISWTKEAINSKDSNELIIYTPYNNNSEISYQKIDYHNYKQEVGHGRLNFVIINNEITTIRKGEVLLPSIGVVLSVAGELATNLMKLLSLEEIQNGYYRILKDYSLRVVLDSPSNIDKDDWYNIKWAFGGGTLLVEDGNNLVASEEEQLKVFRKEGWFHPLSCQTQETQLQNRARDPRTIIGLTKKGELFGLTFSGRTKLSCGVSLTEAVKIINKLFGSIEWALNLDGGASTCLGLVYKGEFFELNYPCTSNTTSAGMVRPVNSMLFIFGRD